MKKQLVFILISSLIIVFSCKKKEASSDTSQSTTTTGPSSNATDFYSNLQTTYNVTDLLGVITRDSVVYADFYSSPPTYTNSTLVYAGSVTLNSVPIPTIGGFKYGISYNAPVNLSVPLTWSISGSGTLTAFSHSFVPSYPKYTGGNLLPDTCSKLAGITLTISGVTNNPPNSVIVRLYGGSANTIKYILNSNGTINFTSQDLASFPTNANLTIEISWANYIYATYGNIKHSFTNNLRYIKSSYLKP